jgi:ribose/xylose/arabinose/galactoside ABC-type transport system permease subunit
VAIAIVALRDVTFLAPRNLQDILVGCAPFAILACGMTFVIITGEIDISVGSMVGLLSVVMGLSCTAVNWGLSVPVTIVIIIVAGALLGLLNGVLMEYGKIPSMIVTLGMLTVFRGITQLLSKGETITNLPAALRFFGTGTIMGIPVCIVTAIIIVILSHVMLQYTPFGRHVVAVGSNPRAAKVLGLPTRRIKIGVFVLMGVLTAIATLVGVPQLAVIESGIGVGWEMLIITCVVVGGTSTAGGRGSIIGSLLGVLLLVSVRTELIFLKLSESATYWERAIQGAFILMAVLADHIGAMRKRKAVKA